MQCTLEYSPQGRCGVRAQVLPCAQQKPDRELAASFIDTIKAGTPLASKGAVDDSASGDEPLWLSVAKDIARTAEAPFQAAGGTGTRATRTIATNWKYVDIQWLVKIKTDAQGNVHYEVRDARYPTRPEPTTLPAHVIAARLLTLECADSRPCR